MGFDFDVIQRSLPYLFLEGMRFTLTLTVFATAGGVILGTLLALMRLANVQPFSLLATGYVNLMRSVPLVLVIFWFYFLVPYMGQWLTGADRPVAVGAFWSSLITFTLFEAAYFSEIMRAGIQSIPSGQIAGQLCAGHDLSADDRLHRAAASRPQHAAGAADANHHPFPGHLAGLRALDHRFSRRRVQGRAARRPPGGDVSLRRAASTS